MLKKDFRGEVWTNVDPRIIAAIASANLEEVDGKVGHDSYTARATEYIQSFFDSKVSVLYTVNGTAANIIALKAMLGRHSAVICAEQTHINTFECGATEYNLGSKILTVPSDDAKLTVSAVDKLVRECGRYSYYPEVIAITQPTELGTLYSIEEIKDIVEYAHSKGMKLFIDGARLGSALATLGVTIKEMISDTGVDVFTIGGTKAGAMFGEAVVFTEGSYPVAGEYILKQSMQHFDKSKFLGVQMERLFEGDLWIENFDHANKMAKMLQIELGKKGIVPYYPVQSNMMFCVIERDVLDKIRQKFDVWYWYEDKKVVRIATTHATTAEAIRELAELI